MNNKNVLLAIGSGILIIIGILFIGLTTAADETRKEEARQKIELRQSSSSSSTTTTQEISFYLDDRTTTCVGNKELIFEDNEHKYYLSCNRSETVFLVYNDNHEVSLKEALANNLVTIKELKDKGLEVIEEAI